MSRSMIMSPRGHLLVLSSDLTMGPVLTVELYVKWYELFMIHSDHRVTPVQFYELRKYENVGVAYIDHCPNPAVVERYASQEGCWLDDLAYDLILGRWTDERSL